MEIVVYEMQYKEIALPESTNIKCIPFEAKYFEEYKEIYNECFYCMRQSLDIKPYNFLSSYEQISEKAGDIYLLIHNNRIVGSVACYGNEIDDLIVSKNFQNNGYGRQLLLWGMQYIRKMNDKPIILHVAQWNKKATELYKKIGFEITHIERVR